MKEAILFLILLGYFALAKALIWITDKLG